MAKYNPTSSDNLRRFDKELSEDVNDFHLNESTWTQARNAINNSKTGDLGKLGNEPGNQYCTEATYTIIGAIHTEADVWVLYSTDETNSEIGLFRESTCEYLAIVNNTCLNFSKFNLVRGTSRSTGDCNWKVYWDDGLNPSRTITLDTQTFSNNLYTNSNSPVPWIQNCVDENGNSPGSPLYPEGCISCTNTSQVDCDLLRLARFVDTPCVSVEKSNASGTLLNGSYFAVIAYCLDGQKITDYFKPSNVQPLFDHDNVAGSIDILIEGADRTFDEFELVVVSLINSQTVAKRIGLYNITQTRVTLDTIDPTLPTVPLDQIPFMVTVYDKTDAMYNVGEYLIRVAPTTKLDFNYQPLANQIVTKWQTVEYPGDYYKNGGTNTGYMRDEVYAFFIRWIYDTGDKSKSYHIPGRPAKTYSFTGTLDTAPYFGPDALAGDTQVFQTFNTATFAGFPGTVLPDGGIVTAEGEMGYWESTEYYPNEKPEVWNASAHPWSQLTSVPYTGTGITDYDLCGEKIRHHKFPNNDIHPAAYHFAQVGNTNVIRVMGVAFDNIKAPVDNNGNPITNIVGYEILRSSRFANKTVIAKGIINNMRLYNIPGQPGITGAYQNYPYNDLRPDPFLSNQQTRWSSGGGNEVPNPPDLQSSIDQTVFSFHSPDTNFARPFLSANELKVYCEYNALVEGKFEWSEEHPKAKVLTDLSFITAAIGGLAIAAISMNGQRTVRRQRAQAYGSLYAYAAGSGVNIPDPLAFGSVGAQNVAFGVGQGLLGSGVALLQSILPGGVTADDFAFTVFGGPLSYDSLALAGTQLANILGGTKDVDYEDSPYSQLPYILRAVSNASSFALYFTQGTDATLDLIRAFVKYQNYALKYNSHGFYNTMLPSIYGNRRRELVDQSYIGPNSVDFRNNYKINNIFRNNFVAVGVNSAFANPTITDFTKQTVTTASLLPPPYLNYVFDRKKPVDQPLFNTVSSCHYAAMKQRLRNQYGQIDSISQILIDNCYVGIKVGKPIPASGTLFGGDIYLGRYTEKTTFFYFYDWLYDQPDGFEFNYDDYKMIPYPRYWLNMEQFDTNDFTNSLIAAIASWNFSTVITPSDYYNLDNYSPNIARFSAKEAYYYLFNSGIRDFYVESEINIDLRDWGELDAQKHYPIITNLKEIFDTNIIKSANYFKYDQSLSVTKTLTNLISWGTVQPRNYSPYLAETCYTYTPTRVIYSLPTQFESKKDNWRLFLANNYYDFDYYVTCIKSVNKSGAMIFFESGSPVQFQGIDQLQTDLGTKLTIGDGGLFSQPMQNIVNVEDSFEYGSCQDSFSVMNTPTGLYWISQNQGKIFKLADGIQEVSLDNMKWWFAQYLPYQILNYFPTFALTNNPVAGVGCQTIFDNQNQLVYFCKRDYSLRRDLPANISLTYLQDDQFEVNVSIAGGESSPIGTTTLGDPLYFEDASWTVSYDPKSQGFISYHDWHPTLTLPGKNTFMSVNPNDKKSIWIHNERCDLYANYYGIDYPFEVEWMVNTGNQVNSLRSVEYQLEVYKYAPNCYDRFHKLDTNFDEAVVYNTEQCSGLLKPVLTPRNNAPAILNYPIINPTNIEILYSKVEQKYRFNQFWDITRDRGEFPIGSPYPPPTPNVGSYAQQTIWNTAANGYVRILNPNNLDYNKNSLQRKKFRHYTTSILLRKLVSGDSKFLVMTSTNKNLYSPR